MTDSPQRGWRQDPNQPPATSYTGYSDPAYAGSAPYGPTYSAAAPPSTPNPTEPLPQYWTDAYAQVPPGLPPEEPPEPPRSPRWLWFAAGLAVVLVIGLVVALIITNSASKKQTVVAPLPAMPEPTSTTAPTTTRTRTPTTTPGLPIPLPTLPTPTTGTTPAGPTEPVVYEVAGKGRAINITYVDEGGVMQTEFNVMLPWRKEVDLPKPAQDSASVTIINVGRDITCSITVSGVQIRERTGAGLTICSAAG